MTLEPAGPPLPWQLRRVAYLVAKGELTTLQAEIDAGSLPAAALEAAR